MQIVWFMYKLRSVYHCSDMAIAKKLAELSGKGVTTIIGGGDSVAAVEKKVPLMQRKEGLNVRPKSTMLEKAIRELEKMVAESRPPTMEVQDADISSQAVKRKLPHEVKQKLAKVARLAQANHGKYMDRAGQSSYEYCWPHGTIEDVRENHFSYAFCFLLFGGGHADVNLFPNVDSSWKNYIAAGDIYGGKTRLASLAVAFPNLVEKETLLKPSELLPFQNHSSQMAALDYIVSFTVLAACTITLLLNLDPDSVLGIILGGGAGARLYPLTKERAKPTVPLGANYHLIDIPVSNCLNSNISKIYVLTQFNSASLNRHLSRAYASNMGGYKNEGFVEVLAARQSPENPNWFQVQNLLQQMRPRGLKAMESSMESDLE
ncbi:hypothetical protein LOK49_LG05G00550 [Camellia lanceoleosa]|uniref:Uncharacterized protein n=1 Tax=Camellia lanceoleosa TaxID=1840588 RepID=A0ACC0HK74_9ERIC|nr:hypothetical protein LOK49_LG05G00550 [Camellia lanceoleosa]